MKTLDEKIEDFLLIAIGFSNYELVENLKSIVYDIANPKL